MNNAQILIVEDEKIIAEDIQDSLREYGFGVVDIESNGEKAIEKAAKLKPDLILMDIMLKGKLNGIETAYKINDNEKIPIIYLTGSADYYTVEEAISTNPFGYLLKPFNKKELYKSVEIAIKKHRTLLSSNKTYSINAKEVEEHFYNQVSTTEIVQKEERKENTTEPAEKTHPFAHVLKPFYQKGLTLKDILSEIDSETITQVNLNKLIEVSFKLAIFNVRRNINKIYNINKSGDLTVEDIAIEAISNLFVTNEKRNMLNLKYSLITWNNPIENDTDGLYFLNKIVSMRVNQYLYKLLKESDPLFSKVLDAVNHCIKKDNYKKVVAFGKTYIVDEGIDEIDGDTITAEELNNVPVNFDYTKNDVLSNLFKYLEKHTSYYQAIPLNALVKRILFNYQKDYESQSFHVSSPMDRICVEDIVKISIEKTITMLKGTYLEKGKISEQDAFVLGKTIIDIANDLKEGQLNWGIYNYLEVYVPDLTKEIYKDKYQNILEYLVKKFKSYVKEQYN